MHRYPRTEPVAGGIEVSLTVDNITVGTRTAKEMGRGSMAILTTLKSVIETGRRQPSTASRLDIGLNLKRVAPSGRLEASSSFNARCTHRVRIEADAKFDASVKSWLMQAYEAA